MEMFISTAFVPGLALLQDYLFNFIIRRRINISYALLNYYSTYFSYWFSLINFAMLDRPIVATPNYKSDTLNVRKPKVRKLVLCRSLKEILWLDLAYVYKTHGDCFSHILPFEYHKYSDIKLSTPNISITKDYKKDPTPAYQHLAQSAKHIIIQQRKNYLHYKTKRMHRDYENKVLHVHV